MNFKQVFVQNKKKAFVLSLALAAFVAGFGLSELRGRQAAASISNDTPLQKGNQYQSSTDSSCPIKAKQSAKGAKVYYYPGSLFYNKVKNPACFPSESAAAAAGYIRSSH